MQNRAHARAPVHRVRAVSAHGRGIGMYLEAGRAKRIVAKTLESLGVNRLLRRTQGWLHRNQYVRAINYHGSPPSLAGALEDQFRYFSEHYAPVSLDDLDRFFSSGVWHKDRPGLLISFDDGLRSNFDVAVPLLEKFGLIGWFF